LDRDAVNAVLAAAGQTTRAPRKTQIGGLTTRELEVLQLIARGQTIPSVADTLTISKKTADTHVTHIYSKIGVTTRAAATLFAMQNNLL